MRKPNYQIMKSKIKISIVTYLILIILIKIQAQTGFGAGCPFINIQAVTNIDVSKSMLPGPPPGSVNVLSGYTVQTPPGGGGFNYSLQRYMKGSDEQQVLNFSYNVFDGYYVLDDQLNANGDTHFVAGIHKNGPFPSPSLPYVETTPGNYQIFQSGGGYRLVITFNGDPGCNSSIVLVAIPQKK
jgi:hypothetical protein